MLNQLQLKIRNARSKWMDRWRDRNVESDYGSGWWKYGLIAIAAYLFVAVLVGIYWSSEPDMFSVRERAQHYIPLDQQDEITTGVATTATLIHAAETLLDKPGGYLSNDIAPPGVWLDNIPSWEYGVLTQVRDLTRAMREAFSRSQSQSTEDDALKQAEAQFNFDNTSWILPSTEEEYRRGIAFLKVYLDRLVDEEEHNAQYYARSDNLRYWLSTVETRLGSLSQNLSASVGQRRLNTNLVGDTTARQATATPQDNLVQTSWTEIDNIFYEARGSAWALTHFLRAIELDFADVLENKNARVSLQQIIRELEGTQQTLASPMVLNGSGFGVLANHSLVMANYISRAHAAIIDLRELLARG